MQYGAGWLSVTRVSNVTCRGDGKGSKLLTYDPLQSLNVLTIKYLVGSSTIRLISYITAAQIPDDKTFAKYEVANYLQKIQFQWHAAAIKGIIQCKRYCAIQPPNRGSNFGCDILTWPDLARQKLLRTRFLKPLNFLPQSKRSST